MLKYLMGVAAVGMTALTAPASLAQVEPFVGQLAPTAATYCARGWHEADGSLIAISQNSALFSLFGTMYGGDGVNSFALPDLRGRMAGGQGQGPGLSMRLQGSQYGSNEITLTASNMPMHSHAFRGSSASGNQSSIGNATLPTYGGSRETYAAGSNLTEALNTNAIYTTGGNQPTYIQQPYNTVRWCVAMFGIYPSRN